ncbi:MAG: tRNA(fMet)-specific endonuclease VapC [Bacteroidota bacterium]|jgi:predicted nucleic acid-binding protein
MNKVFVDTDICIDLLSGRQPFNTTAEKLFSFADLEKLELYVSALTFSNIDYVLRSQYSSSHSRQIIARFKTLVNVLSVESKTIDLAIASDFNDFEDAIQHACALENNIPVILTRNIKDFKKSVILVVSPETFLTSLS